ncbi:hypothetical protein LU196_06270 [Pantoea sp. Mb-10]|uniref:hypothetical protein n=1 Tax=unclassified Pantoea TaxID=2630326 RepID=UPI001E63C3A3|nr:MULTISPECIES: hypothetical protein [unclassified Pantoea]MCE0489656.1 hypothetical protein [Pantoea sp. Mb-10]MCE0501239.1 hypothetical protein [Pantoea sp. Pb-8]
MKRLARWWQKQDKKQHHRLRVGAAILSLLLLTRLYQCGALWRDNAWQTLLSEQRALQQLPQLEQALSQFKSAPQATADGCFSPQSCAEVHRLAIKLKEENGVTVLVEPARISFNDWVVWLQELERRFQLYATQVEITQHSSYILLEQMELRYAK